MQYVETKNQNFIKNQEAKGLLSNLGVTAPLSKVSILDSFEAKQKLNEIANKFLLAGDKFMPEMHLKQPTSLDKS